MTMLESLERLAEYSMAEMLRNSEYGDMNGNISAGSEILTALETLGVETGVDIDVLNANEHVKEIRRMYEWAKKVKRGV